MNFKSLTKITTTAYIKKTGVFLLVFAAGVLVGAYTLPLKKIQPLPQIETLEQNLPQLNLEQNLSVKEASPGALLRVLNGKVLPVYNQPNRSDKPDRSDSPEATEAAIIRLSALRIIGEVENTGDSTVTEATAVLRFFDENNKLITTKIANWNNEIFPLDPQEIRVYDVVVPNPPKSETIAIELRPLSTTSNESNADDQSNQSGSRQKIHPLLKNRQFEPAEMERRDPQTKEKIKIKYYKFTATLVNNNDFDIVAPTIYLWIKNDKNEVIGLAQKGFPNDVLATNEELPVEMLIVPLTKEEVFTHEVKVEAKKL